MAELQVMFKTINDLKESIHTTYDITRQIGKWKSISRGLEITFDKVDLKLFDHFSVNLTNTLKVAEYVKLKDTKSVTKIDKNIFKRSIIDYCDIQNDNRKNEYEKKNLLVLYENCN